MAGPAGPSDLKFWGTFSGFPPAVALETGGQVALLSFQRLNAGVYRITLDMPRQPVTGVGVIASAVGAPLSFGAHGLDVVGTRQLFDVPGDRLVIEVTAISFINDPVFGFLIVGNLDTIFSLAVFDNVAQ